MRKFRALIASLLLVMGALIVSQAPAHAAAYARKSVCYFDGYPFWVIQVEGYYTSYTSGGVNYTSHADPYSAIGVYLPTQSEALQTAPIGQVPSYKVKMPYGSAEPSFIRNWRPKYGDAYPTPFNYTNVYFSANEPCFW